jgi:hypothetical protein
MTITFEHETDVIVYAFEKVISYAKKNQQIFVAQCVWWLALIVGIEQELVKYIDNIQSRINVTIIPEKVPREERAVSPEPRDNQEDQRQDKILAECKEFLKDSKRLREIASLKAKGRTSSGRINPTTISKERLRKKDRRPKKAVRPETAGIDTVELQRRQRTGECLRCAWPSDRKGSHRVADCRRPIKLDKGTKCFPKAKEYLKATQVPQQESDEEETSETSSSEESSDDSL